MEPWKYQWKQSAYARRNRNPKLMNGKQRNNAGVAGGIRVGGIRKNNNQTKSKQQNQQQNSAKKLTLFQRKYLRKLMENGATYKDAFPQALKAKPEQFPVAIMHSDHPAELLTQDQMTLIQNAIINLIVTEPVEGNQTVSFLSCTQKPGGWLVINCANAETRDWVLKEIPKLSPWQDADLNAVDEKDVPKYLTFEAEIADAEDSQVLTTLKKMNAGLKTQEWKIISKVDATYTFLVDEESAKALEKAQNKAFYGFGQVTFKKISS